MSTTDTTTMSDNGSTLNDHEMPDSVADAIRAATATDGVARIDITPIDVGTLRVPIIGTAPLIVHRFSEKSRAAMLDAQQKKAVVKATRDPESEYVASRYRFADGGDGLPVIAFKSATIGAARFYAQVKMTELRLFLYFRGELGLDNQALARIEGEPHMREDYVRFGVGSTDLRYRAEFTQWSTTLDVQYVKSALSQGSVLSLIEAGGLGGVGEWRPSGKKSSGEAGTYEIDHSRDVQVLG
jgi:hypothetical protein